MKVLMTTDGSKQATTALLTASRLLRRGDHQCSLLCVAPELLPQARGRAGERVSAKIHKQYRRHITEETERILKQAQVALQGEGIEADTRMALGSPANEIVRLAAEYDLTVVGAHDRYEQTKPGLGRVASRVVAYAPGAVLVGRELTADRGLRVLLAADGSLASAQAISLMTAALEVGAFDMTLMHVVETPWIHLGLDREWFDFLGATDRADPELQLERELRREAEVVIDEARRRLERAGLSAKTIIEEGDPALEILSEAERSEYDLIVIGATGESDLKHHLLGSVSTKVAQDAPCSVLVAKFAE
jgi:nucleotide-binding universal stress UspA family protein